ncbi:queuosine 5'-phosphate N-glycosylase/hydrolase isoform X2 [Planococcus citri]
MSKVLQSCELVAKEADIKIDLACAKELANKVYQEVIDRKLTNQIFHSAAVHPKEKNEKSINWIFLIDTLNFCFWSTNKSQWRVTWNGETYSGYFALCAAVNRAMDEGIDMTNPEVYGNLSFEKFSHILKGDNDVELSLMSERYDCLRESSSVLLEKFSGSFANCIRDCDQSAQKLLDIIVSNFPHYRDEATYNNFTVYIYKRAQILVADIWSCFEGKDLGTFTDIDTITMFADYRVPQVLCYFGVLQYPDELLVKLIDGTLLENGSKDEVEIRATSVVAVARINDFVQQKLKESNKTFKCNSILVDQYLWTYRRNRAKYLDCIPFHKTLTIYY